MFAGIMLRGKPREGNGVALYTLMVLVVNFSAAPSDAEEARAIAMIVDNLIFMVTNSEHIEDDATLMRFLINFNMLAT